MLTSRDLDAIRRIMREEIRRALLGDEGQAPDAPPEGASDPHGKAMNELVASDLAKARGEPGAADRSRRAWARYRANYDSWYRARALKALGRAPDGAVTDDKMMELLERWSRNRKRKTK